MIAILKETFDRLPEEETKDKYTPKILRKRQSVEDTCSASDFVQSKFAQHAMTVARGEETYTRRHQLEEDLCI